MGTELKSDASHRGMMYSRDAYEGGRIFLTAEQKQAVEEGKKFTQRAHADVWARDAALVRRVRAFLGTHFYWHQRLLRVGADLEVVETLRSMIRGESVVLVAQEPSPGGIASGLLPPSSGAAMGFVDAVTRWATPWAEGAAFPPGEPLLSGPYDPGTQQAKRIAARNAMKTDDLPADLSTPLADAQPFEYTPDTIGDAEEIAARGVRLTGNEPGGYRIHPSGLDIDYFDSNGNLCAQYHQSRGDAHGHNFDAGVRDDTHFPMSPINRR
jgi:hypothetical protein